MEVKQLIFIGQTRNSRDSTIYRAYLSDDVEEAIKNKIKEDYSEEDWEITIEAPKVVLLKKSPVPQAMEVVVKALRGDKKEGSYYYSWQSNIAMAFYDTYKEVHPEADTEDLHNIANKAAINFLNNLIN